MTARATTMTAEPIHSFDHSGLADLPEYAAASAALLALSEVIDRNGLGVGADDRILDDPDEPAPALLVIAPPAPRHHQETAA